MAYRLPAERVTVEVGPTVEVESIGAWPIYHTAIGLISACTAATTEAATADALHRLYTFFVAEAMPTWEIIDHRGPILPTAEGMLRLPVNEVALAIIEAWAETFVPKPSAVDEMIPEGPLRDELNAGLRAAKKAH
jgi:hypothetical protein